MDVDMYFVDFLYTLLTLWHVLQGMVVVVVVGIVGWLVWELYPHHRL